MHPWPRQQTTTRVSSFLVLPLPFFYFFLPSFLLYLTFIPYFLIVLFIFCFIFFLLNFFSLTNERLFISELCVSPRLIQLCYFVFAQCHEQQRRRQQRRLVLIITKRKKRSRPTNTVLLIDSASFDLFRFVQRWRDGVREKFYTRMRNATSIYLRTSPSRCTAALQSRLTLLPCI